MNNLLRAPEMPQSEIGDYILSHTLGEGTTGKVKLAYHKETGQQVAIKIIPKISFDQRPDLQLKVQREIAIMRLVDHPNILKLIDVLESGRHLYIILEYAEQGELFDYLVSNRFLAEDVAIEFFRQIVIALEYLHKRGICHRDLKPENILLDSCARIKIADFGFARWVKSSLTETSCGSPHYAAPEIIRGQPYDGKIADIWSLGVILYALLAGYLPFDDPSIRNLLNKVKRGVFQMPAFPAPIQDLIRKMLTVDVNQRITIEEIKAHPCFRFQIDPEYVIPTPLPFAEYGVPIDITTLSDDVLEVLNQIGFTNTEELTEQLETTENTMAKIFVKMLTTGCDLEQLPWEDAYSGPPKPLIDPSVITTSEESNFPAQPMTDALHRFKENPIPQQSIEMYSVANRPDWALNETPGTEVFEEESIETYGIRNWAIMCQLQKLLGDMNFQWFHPDPLTIFARTFDDSLIVSLVGTYRTADDLTIYAKLHKGDASKFKDFVQSVSEAITL